MRHARRAAPVSVHTFVLVAISRMFLDLRELVPLSPALLVQKGLGDPCKKVAGIGRLLCRISQETIW